MEVSLAAAVLALATLALGLFVLSRSSSTLVNLAILISIVVNLAGYSFLTYDAGGAKRIVPGGDIITFMPPILLVATIVVVFLRIGSPLARYVRRNADVLLLAFSAILSTFFALDQPRAAQYSIWLAVSVVAALVYFFLLGAKYRCEDWGAHMAGLLFIGNAPFLVLVASGASNFDGRIDVLYSSKLFWTYAASIVVPAVLVMSRRLRPKAGWQVLAKIPWPVLAAIAMFAAGVLLLSGKRNPIGSTALVVVLYMTLGSRSQLRAGFSSTMRMLVLSAGIVLVAWQLSPLADRTWERFEKLTDPRRNTSVQARKEIMENGLDVFARYPVFGVGIANGRNAIKRYHPNDETTGLNLHNTLLGILVETGLVGLLLFTLVSVRTIYLLVKYGHTHFKVDWMLLSIPPALVSLTEYNLTPGQAMFWPLLLILVAPRALLALPEGRRLEDFASAPSTRRRGWPNPRSPRPNRQGPMVAERERWRLDEDY